MAAQPSYEELLQRLDKVERNAQIARDYVEISNLHGRYNHLCLGHYWDKIVDELFAQKTPGVKVEIVESVPRARRCAQGFCRHAGQAVQLRRQLRHT
jgi:hypothetical protein